MSDTLDMVSFTDKIFGKEGQIFIAPNGLQSFIYLQAQSVVLDGVNRCCWPNKTLVFHDNIVVRNIIFLSHPMEEVSHPSGFPTFLREVCNVNFNSSLPDAAPGIEHIHLHTRMQYRNIFLVHTLLVV